MLSGQVVFGLISVSVNEGLLTVTSPYNGVGVRRKTMENSEYISQHIRLLKEQNEWLRGYCYKTEKSKAQVIREALELYRATVEEKKNKEDS